MIARRREFGCHRVALRPRRFFDQLARQDEMFGKPPRLVAVDRKLARALIEEDARGAFEQHRGEQDRDDLSEQAEAALPEPAQTRTTGELRIKPLDATGTTDAGWPGSQQL